MKCSHLVAVSLVAASIGWFARSGFSDDAAPKPAADPMEEMMAKLATPGEQHERMKALVGEWTVHGKFTNPATGKVEESESASSIRAVMGGRYFIQDVKGSMMGQPFEGHGIMGFDNATQKYVSSWIDSMGTGILTSTGEETEKGRTWTFHGPWDLGGGKSMATRLTIKMVSDKEAVWEMWMGPDEKSAGSVMTLHATKK